MGPILSRWCRLVQKTAFGNRKGYLKKRLARRRRPSLAWIVVQYVVYLKMKKKVCVCFQICAILRQLCLCSNFEAGNVSCFVEHIRALVFNLRFVAPYCYHGLRSKTESVSKICMYGPWARFYGKPVLFSVTYWKSVFLLSGREFVIPFFDCWIS